MPDRLDAAALGGELVFGLVGAIGTDLGSVSDALSDALTTAGYQHEVIRLSTLLREIDAEPWKALPEPESVPEDDRYHAYMDAGDELRRRLQRGEAVALLAVGNLRYQRKKVTGHVTSPRTRAAYILRSLKRPEEVELLRQVYGRSFALIGAYSPREVRLQNLARKIAKSHYSGQPSEHREEAEQLLLRDQKGADDVNFGQSVGATFPLSDVFVNAGDATGLANEINRFVDVLFGYPYHSPSRHENAMFHAQAAALRSLSLARQVGAVISTPDGDIIAVGTNEVPKAGGGLYWCDDDTDKRDFTLGFDTSDDMKSTMLQQLLERLKRAGWLAPDRAKLDARQLAKEALHGPSSVDNQPGTGPLLKGSHFMNVIEFFRAEHAETAALLDAARRGVPVKGCDLYTTLFPCHDCAKHLVAAGIRRVYYIEPYPKSLASELHMDSVAVDSECTNAGQVTLLPFVGIAPRRYMELFSAEMYPPVERKQRDGKIINWVKASATPRYSESTLSYIPLEEKVFTHFKASMVLNRLYKEGEHA